MSAPTTPEDCRDAAAECGARATRHLAFGEVGKARREIQRARELTLLALKLEQEAASDLPPGKAK